MRRGVRGAAVGEVLRLLEIALSTADEALRREAMAHAVELSRSFRVRIPRRLSLLICRKCMTPYRFDVSRVRVRRGRAGLTVTVTCGSCGAVRRIPLKP
ncbi:MAG: ribonuclease P [Nitrososphaerota archaeon]